MQLKDNEVQILGRLLNDLMYLSAVSKGKVKDAPREIDSVLQMIDHAFQSVPLDLRERLMCPAA